MFSVSLMMPVFSSGFKDDEDESKWNLPEVVEENLEDDVVFMDNEEEIAAENLKRSQGKSDEKSVQRENQKIEKARIKLYKDNAKKKIRDCIEFSGLSGMLTEKEINEKITSTEDIILNGIRYKKVRFTFDKYGRLTGFTGNLRKKGNARTLKRSFSKHLRFDMKDQIYYAKNMDSASVKYLGGEYFVVIEFNQERQ